jgi:predicted GNAT family acetyltransferase
LNTSENIEIRGFRSSTDEAFVYSTWLRNYKHSSYFAKRIRPVTFFAGHHNIASHILKKESVKVFVACPKDDIETILGYLVCEPDSDKQIIHFVFVKDAFRGLGVARALVEASQIDINKIHFTHWTYPVDEFIRKYPDIIYDPYKL